MNVARKRKSRTSLNLTFYLNTLYLASILFTRLKFTCVKVRSQKGFMHFHCRVIFPCVNKIDIVWKVTQIRKSWTSLNFYVYAWPFLYCLYFIYARKFYLLSHGKITQQWKSTLRLCSQSSDSFARGRKPCRKNRDFGEISVAERGCAAPISKVARHISERFWASLWCSVHTYS